MYGPMALCGEWIWDGKKTSFTVFLKKYYIIQYEKLSNIQVQSTFKSYKTSTRIQLLIIQSDLA